MTTPMIVGSVRLPGKKRRSSMAVLYDRIVHSERAPIEMQCMDGALFALQTALLVCYAAKMGKARSS